MSQILIQKQEKLWQILDDCVKTNKYKQVKGLLGTDNLACVMGVFAAYRGANTEKEREKTLRDDDKIDFGNTFFPFSLESKNEAINALKKCYNETGKIHFFTASWLNDRHNVSFSEFRDIFQEMGV